jgi:hypothetical protein
MKRVLYLLIFIITIGVDICYAGQDKEDATLKFTSAGPVTTWTGPLCGRNKFAIQPFFFYNRTSGIFNSEGRYDPLAGSDRKGQFQEQLFMQYGLTDKLEVATQTVYQQNYVRRGGQTAHAAGLGDSYLFLRYCFFEEDKELSHATGLLQLKLPTGKFQKFDPEKLGADSMGATSGGGSYDLGAGLILTKKIRSFVLHGDAIFSLPLETSVDNVKTRYAGYLNYDLGIEYFFKKGFNVMLELNGFIQGDKAQNGEKQASSDIKSFSGAAGIGWSNNMIQTLLAYQRTLIGTNVDANDSVVITFVHTF